MAPQTESVRAPAARVPARPLAGALLLTAGGWLLAGRFGEVGVELLAVAVGGVLLGGWVRTRRARLLLIGAPLLGSGAGLLARPLVDGQGLGATAVLLGITMGLLAAAAVRRWAAAPAVLSGALALAASGIDLERALPRPAAGVALSAVVIGLGLVQLVRSRIPRAVEVGTTALLLAASTLAVAVVAASLFSADRDAVSSTRALVIPDLADRTLVVAWTGQTVLREGPLGGEVMLVGDDGSRSDTPVRLASAVEVLEFGDRVVVREIPGPGAPPSLTLYVPVGAHASVLGGAGDVVAELRGQTLDIDTTSGGVTVTGHARSLHVRTRSGATSMALEIHSGDDVVVRTESGDVDARVEGAPRVTADAATIFVEGYGAPRTGLPRFVTRTGRGSLAVRTVSGAVSIVRGEDPAAAGMVSRRGRPR